MIEMDKLKRRVQVFYELQTPVHVVTYDDTWLNGYITSVSSDFFMIIDRKDGELPVFYSDVNIFDFFVGDVTTLKKKEVRE